MNFHQYQNLVRNRRLPNGRHKNANGVCWMLCCLICRTSIYLAITRHRRYSQLARFTWPTWDPLGSCRPQVGPMLAHEPLLSGFISSFSAIRYVFWLWLWFHSVIDRKRRYQWPNKISANDGIRNICKIFLHWLIPCSQIKSGPSSALYTGQ